MRGFTEALGGQALLAALRPLLPKGAAAAWADPRRDHGLWDGEHLLNAVEKRHMEFSAGRAAARQAMAQLSLPPQAIIHGKDRAPIWPQGITGSISHSASDCLAVVWLAHQQGIGIDLEPATPLEPALWPIILRPEEQDALQHADDPAMQAKRIFTIKEAVYKAQYPLSRQLFGFDAISVSLQADQSMRFSTRFLQQAFPFRIGDILTGCHLQVEDQLLALCHT